MKFEKEIQFGKDKATLNAEAKRKQQLDAIKEKLNDALKLLAELEGGETQ